MKFSIRPSWLALLIILESCLAVYGYLNPIIPGVNPDPSILRVGSDYWLVVSSFEFMPGIPIYHSTDLVNWTLHSHALTRSSQLSLYMVPQSLGVWASTIRYHNGRYYISSEKLDNYPTSWPRGFYVWSDDIASGVWSEPVYFDNPGFDADLFFDDDGTVYLSNTRAIVFDGPHAVAAYNSKIDLATGTTLTRPEVLVNSTVPWIEGTHLYKLNGTYYLFTASGGTQTNNHQEQAFRSSIGPTGPWEPCPWNPVAHNPNGLPVQNTGHADIVQAEDGNWWAVLLARRNQGAFAQLGRETYLVPVTWIDGWPVFNNHEPIAEVMPGLTNISRPTLWIDDFEPNRSNELSIGWYTVRTPYKTQYSLSARAGYLRIYGNFINLTEVASPAVYLRKQTDFNATWSTSLEYYPSEQDVGEAGVVLWLTEDYNQAIGIRRCDSDPTSRCIVTTTNTGSNLTFVEKFVQIPTTGPVQLFIKAETRQYSLGYSLGSNNTAPTYVISFPNSLVPQSLSYSGYYFGLYSTGRSLPNLVPADFAYARVDVST